MHARTTNRWLIAADVVTQLALGVAHAWSVFLDRDTGAGGWPFLTPPAYPR
jgi:hypothetical protein